MVTLEEKKKIIEDIINMIHKEVPSLEIQLRLHELLLRDTDKGRLYKYRSFDKEGYSLKNLQEGTLHCSTPDAFNDPFDCQIGITMQSLYTAKYETEINEIETILEHYIDVFNGKIRIEECSMDEQRIIRKLLKSKILNDFIITANENVKSEDETILYLRKNADVVIELMQIVLADETFKESLGICVDMLPRMMKNISPEGLLLISENNVSFEDYACANGVMDDADEVGLTMLLGNKLYPEYNELADNLKKQIDVIEHQLSDKMKTLFLVGCLCTSYKNRLMWSHYADGHKGFCIEYDFSGSEEAILSKIPFPVFYSDDRPLVPWKAALDNSKKNIEEASRKLMIGLLTKDKAWKYENEWRILIEATKDSELLMPKISCVYLGAAIEKKNRDKIIKIARKNNYVVKQMKMDRGAYDLHAENVRESN